MHLNIWVKKKKVRVPVHRVSPVGKITGLMFKSKNVDNLLFEFKKPTD